MRLAFQLANIAIEGNEIVGQEGSQAAASSFSLSTQHRAILAARCVLIHAFNAKLLATHHPGQSAPGGEGGTVPFLTFLGWEAGVLGESSSPKGPHTRCVFARADYKRLKED